MPQRKLWSANTHSLYEAVLQLALMDRDFTDEDYEMLMALDRGGGANARPVSQEALDELPRFTHHAPTKARHGHGHLNR